MSHEKDEPLSEADFEAARRALERNWPDLLADTPLYKGRLDVLAAFHQHLGRDRFELHYNLRSPEGKVEQWEREFVQGEITADELKSRLRSDAERPIDAEMLKAFCESYEAQLEHYGEICQAAVRSVHSPRDPEAWRKWEPEIDKHVEALKAKTGLWRENLQTVFDFLDEMRVDSGLGLVKLGEFEGTSAHWLAARVLDRAVEAWDSCKAVARRSQTDPRYLYSTTAAALFFEVWLPRLPQPQALYERMREEHVRARRALGASRQLRSAGNDSQPTVSRDLRRPLRVFYSYSHKDESLRDDIETHLSILRREEMIQEWHDRKIGAGEEWKGLIDKQLEAADIVLLLVSADFLSSDYCYDVEMKRALQRHDAGDARVIPIILRSCDWAKALFAKLQALPKDGQPITSWRDKDEALANVAEGIRKAVADLTQSEE